MFKSAEELTKYLEDADGSVRFEGFYPNQIYFDMMARRYKYQLYNYTIEL